MGMSSVGTLAQIRRLTDFETEQQKKLIKKTKQTG